MQGITFVLQGLQGFLPWKLLVTSVVLLLPKGNQRFFLLLEVNNFVFSNHSSLCQIPFFFSVGT